MDSAILCEHPASCAKGQRIELVDFESLISYAIGLGNFVRVAFGEPLLHYISWSTVYHTVQPLFTFSLLHTIRTNFSMMILGKPVLIVKCGVSYARYFKAITIGHPRNVLRSYVLALG